MGVLSVCSGSAATEAGRLEAERVQVTVIMNSHRGWAQRGTDTALSQREGWARELEVTVVLSHPSEAGLCPIS